MLIFFILIFIHSLLNIIKWNEDKNKKLIEKMWQEYEPYIRKLCNFKLKSLPYYIDDCIQDVFLDLSDALNSGKQIEYPKAWLSKVANNKIKDIYAQAKKESENKTIRFPVPLIERINNAIKNQNVSFSAFVIQACEYALNELDNEK